MKASPREVLNMRVRDQMSDFMLNMTWLGHPVMAMKEKDRSNMKNSIIIEWQFGVLWAVVP